MRGLFMPIINYDNKYIEITKSCSFSVVNMMFLYKIKREILRDPKRRAYIRESLIYPGKYTVYASIPESYDSDGYKNIYDKSEIVRGF